MIFPFQQRLLFVCGKGGVGRTTISCAMAQAYALRGERVLLVQWALRDSISGRFQKPPCNHTVQVVAPGLETMNFQPDEAIREYFVDHLGLRLLHQLIIENKHVQRLIHAAPGVQELFFLGRLFWLTCLSLPERGWQYDRIIVDTPATGHGASLFQLPQTISQFGMTGPLAYESERVAKLLADSKITGVILATLPEELPVEETIEFAPQLTAALGRPPLAFILNRSVREACSLKLNEAVSSDWFQKMLQFIPSEQAQVGLKTLLGEVIKRSDYEKIFNERILAQNNGLEKLPIIALPDVVLSQPQASPSEIIMALAKSFGGDFKNV